MAQVVRPSTGLRARSAKIVLAASFTALSMLGHNALGAGKGVQVDKVTRGTADFQFNGPQTTIRASNGAIINYRFFNIDPGQSVQFVQPSASSRVLNRISGAEPSKINGVLQANGIVYLVNPSGVIFGPNSVVDVGRIYAAGGKLTDSNFLANINRFALSAPVSNQGLISGQQVHLLGTSVANEGAIKAEGGLVSMVAGDQVTLGTRDGHIVVKVGTADVPQQTAGGANLMGAGDMYSFAVKNTGTIKASDVHVEAQGTGTVNVSGKIDASNVATGGTGGNVVVTGGSVALKSATIDASGNAGGGKILVGGDLHGQGDTRTASQTSISSDSVIRADALSNGTGGMIIVWSDQLTQFSGAISARGGLLGGDGGFAEVSGKNLAYNGKADLSSPKGKGGNLLIDPLNLDVVDDGTPGAADSSFGLEGDTVADGDTTTYGLGDNPGIDVKLQVSTITDVLKGGETVTLAAEHNLTIDSVIDVSASPGASGAGLNLRAGNDVTINQAIKLNGGVIDLHSNDPTGGFASGSGNVTINNQVITNGGSFHSAGVNFDSSAGSLSVISASFDHTGSVILVHNGDLHLSSSTIGGTLNILNMGNLTVDSGQTISTGGQANIMVQPAGGLFTLSSGATIQPATGGVILQADKMNLAGTINAPGQQVTLEQVTVGTLIDLGSVVDTTPNTLELSAAELNNVIASTLQVGQVGAGDITVSSNIGSGATWTTLAFQTSGAVGGPGTITSNALSIASINGVGSPITPLSLSVDMLAISNVATGGISVINDKALAVSSVSGFNGILSSGDVNITADSLFIDRPIVTGGGTLSAITTHNLTSSALGTINTSNPADGGSAGNVTLNSNLGQIVLSGDIVASGTDSASGNAGNGGAVQLSSSQGLSVANITTSGGNATSLIGDNNGGNAGAMVLLGGASPFTVTLNGNLIAAGGNPSGLGNPGFAAEIDIESAAVLGANVSTFGSQTAFFSTLDGTAPGAQTLTVNGNATFLDVVGSTTPLKSISVSGFATIQGGSVVTQGDQTYTSGLTIAANDLTFDTGGGNLIVGSVAGSGQNLILASGIGGGTTTFTGDINNLGSGTGPALLIKNGVTGLVDFQFGVNTNSGLVAENSTSKVKFEGGASIGAGGTNTNLPGAVEIAGGTFSTFGDASLGTVTLSTDTVTLNSNGANIQIASMDGGSQNLILDAGIGAGTTTFLGNVIQLGSGTGAALTISDGVTGLVDFQSTLSGNSGLVALDNTTTSSIRFGNSVTLIGGDTATNLPGNVTLAGGTFSAFNGIAFGATTLATGRVTLNSNGGNITIASLAGGGQNLILDGGIGAGTTTIIGDVTNLGSGTGAALAIGPGVTGLVKFQGTVDANSGLVGANNLSNVEFDNNVTLANGDTATNLPGTVAINGTNTTISGFDGLSFGATTLGTNPSIVSNGGNIQFSSIVGAGNTLSLNAGTTGTINVTGDVTNLNALTMVNSNGATFSGNYDVSNPATFTILDTQAAGTIQFNGNAAFNTFTATHTTNAYSVAFNAGAGAQTTNIGTGVFNNTGSISFGNDAGDKTSFSVSALDTITATNRPSLTILGGTIDTTAGGIKLGAAQLGADTILNPDASNAQNISFTTLDGKGHVLTLSAGIATGTTTFTGNVTGLGTANGADGLIIQTGDTGLVDFQGTLTTNSGIAANSTTSNVRFAGDVSLGVGSQSSNLPGAVELHNITFAASDKIQLGGVTLTGSGPTALDSNGHDIIIASLTGADNLILAGGIGAGKTSVTGNVTNLGSGTGAAITIQSGVTGLVDFHGTMTGTSGIQAPGVDSTLQFDGNVTFTGGDTGTALSGAVNTPAITFKGANGLTFGTLTLTGGGTTTIQANDTNANGAIHFVNGVSGTTNSLVVNTSGSTTFDSAINVASITTDAGGSSSFNGITTTGTQAINENNVTVAGAYSSGENFHIPGNVTLSGNTTITTTATGKTITFDKPINDNHIGGDSLTLTANGAVIQVNSIGNVNALSQFIVQGNSQSTFIPGSVLNVSSDVTPNGDVISINVPVKVSGASTFANSGSVAGNITFNSTIDGTTAGADSLTVNGNKGTTSVLANVGSTTPLNNLIFNSGTTIRLKGNVTTTGGRIAFGGPLDILTNVVIQRNVGSGDTNTGPFSTRNGIFFGNSVDSFFLNNQGALVNQPFNLTVLANAPAAVDKFPIIVFSGPVGATSPFGIIHLNTPAGSTEGIRANTPEVASIIFAPTNTNDDLLPPSTTSSFSTSVNITTEFSVGRREKISALGNLTIHADPNGVASVNVGDINTLHDLSISAPKVFFQRRESGSVRESDGNVTSDTGVDFVAGGSITISASQIKMLNFTDPGNITNGDASTNVVFAAGTAPASVPGFRSIQTAPVAQSDMIFGGASSPQILDLRATNGPGAPSIDGSNAIAGAIKLPNAQATPSETTAPLGSGMVDLSAVGIHTRELTQEEVMQGLEGRYFFFQSPSDTNLQVAVARLDPDAVASLMNSYRTFFFSTTDGKVVAQNQKDHIRDALSRALAAYHQQHPTARAVVPSEFRAFVNQSPEYRAVASYLSNLRAVLDRLNYLNLTQREIAAARQAILSDVKPAGLSLAEFEAIVMTPAAQMAMK